MFATPSGRTARADPKMVTGEGLGTLSPLLKADANAVPTPPSWPRFPPLGTGALPPPFSRGILGRSAYLEMEQSDAGFRRPISYGEIRAADFDALMLTGGHAPGMRVYLGSGVLQSAVGDFFAQKKPVGAICHGVLLAARSSFYPGKSVLYGKKTTALTKQMELIARRLTRLYLGDYYRTYPTTIEDEVGSALARPEDFITGPLLLSPVTMQCSTTRLMLLPGCKAATRRFHVRPSGRYWARYLPLVEALIPLGAQRPANRASARQPHCRYETTG